MRKFFSSLRAKLSTPDYETAESGEGYVEIPPEGEQSSNVIVRPFQLDEFDDVKQVLDSLREGKTIALVNIRPLKDRDLVELKRAINKLKKTTDAIDGQIAGFGEDYIVITPQFASIYRNKETSEVSEAPESRTQE